MESGLAEDLVHTPPLNLLKRYLAIHGWSREVLKNRDLELFELVVAGSGKLEIVLPGPAERIDEKRRIADALSTLSALGGRSEREIAADVSMLDYDIIRARLPDSKVFRDGIGLRVAEKFVGNLRRFLVSAAAAERSHAIMVQSPQKQDTDYGDECRFGHTFRGSFGFTIESLAGPAPSLHKDLSPPPFQRRVVERMAIGLAIIERASEANDVEALVASTGKGFNLNMLQDFSALLAESASDQLSFGFRLTPAWPPSPVSLLGLPCLRGLWA